MKTNPIKHADILFTGGRVFTGSPMMPHAEAVAVTGNRISAVGSAAGLARFKGRGTRVVNLKGKLACAGFIDSHAHLMPGGFSLLRADLTTASSKESLLAEVRAKAVDLAEGAWLQGRGWNQDRLGGVWPKKEWLDEATGSRPAFLWRVDGHIAWANSAALAAAGITRDTPNPPGGEIVRDEAGEPAGVLKERAAALVETRIPDPNAKEREAALEIGLAMLRRHGVTSIHEMSEPWALAEYRKFQKKERLSVRVSAWAELARDTRAAEALREAFPADDPMIRCATMKGFVDGTLGASTAALQEPYQESGGLGASPAGILLWPDGELERAVAAAHAAGFQIALHAIGDRAVSIALSAYESLGEPARARRHRIEHAELVAPADLPRFAALGIVASMQPAQLLSDGQWMERRIGERRMPRAFPWRELADRGATIIFGTDWPVEPIDPMKTLYGATASIARLGRTDDRFRTGRQLTIDEALLAMTKTPAWASFEEEHKGTLVAGRYADLVVLSDDPYRTRPEGIAQIQVEMTVFDGRIVHEIDSEKATA